MILEMKGSCGHDIEVFVVPCGDDCDNTGLCQECIEAASAVADDAECGDCYRRNHPSLTAYERNS